MSSVADRYGVFGHPVGHSLSPFIHAMFARETAQDISYRAFEVTREEFAPRVHTFFGEGGRGLNVTLPHKLAAVEVAVELTDRTGGRLGTILTVATVTGTSATAVTPPTVTVGLSITLPSFYQQQGEIRRAESDARTQALSQAKAQAQVVSDVETAFAAR